MSEINKKTVLNDRYELGDELGRGGMGVVYRAHDAVLDRDVAVKVMNQTGLGTEGRARLLSEAQAVAKLNHPNIVTVHDAGEIDGTPYIVMELVEGESLYQHPPDGFAGMLAMAGDVSSALEHAHSHEIIHRDLKPENIVIASDGTAKLMDFGLARSMATRVSVEGEIVGTVFYIAPEVAMGQDLDGRADLYSLGVILYEQAQCKDVTVPTDPGLAEASFVSVDDGSFDPDGDPIILDQTPGGPYQFGQTPVSLRVTDSTGVDFRDFRLLPR